MDNANIKLELEGISSDNGLDAYGTHPAIWVPHEIKLEFMSLSTKNGLSGENQLSPVITYPLPKIGQPNAKLSELMKIGRTINQELPLKDVLDRVEKEFNKKPEAYDGLPITKVSMAEFIKAGWKVRQDTSGLLNDFLKLAQEEINDKLINRVKKFASKWGPLWICRNSDHLDCFWSYEGVIKKPENPCCWLPTEEVSAFVSKALQARAFFDAATLLLQGKKVPAETWLKLDSGKTGNENPAYNGNIIEAEFDIAAQKMFLASIMNKYLSSTGSTVIWMTWGQESKPALHISSGKGFLFAVWTQIAQNICNARGIYKCDGCGDFYVRTRKKPQKGRRNFCLNCGEGEDYKASKREYWRNRGKRVGNEK